MASRQKKPEYKPLLFSTTVRNPSRMKDALKIMSKFEGKTLTNKLAKDIFKEVIKKKKYSPRKAWNNPLTRHLKEKYYSEESLTNSELDLIIDNIIQDHKQRDFKHGWPSRFHTFFDMHRQFGFLYYARPGVNDELAQKIKISPLGKRLLQCDENINVDIDTSELETNIFAHSLTKYHGNNPFIKRKNANIPLILLAQVINLLNSDIELEGKGVGISLKELALLLVWKDNDADALYREIKKIRLENPFPTSDEIILEACDSHSPRWNSYKDESLIKELPDEFIRKMRITGLFALRGAGRYLDINKNKKDKLNYILSNYQECQSFSDNLDYFNYCSKIDENILKLEEEPILIGDDYKLDKWIQEYPWEIVSNELKNLKKGSSKDPILKSMNKPVRAEFLCAIALKHKLINAEIIPRYKIDDEGVPYVHAPGGGHDIECKEKNMSAIIEITLHTSSRQVSFEGPQTQKHLADYKRNNPNQISECWFVAPSIHEYFERWARFETNSEGNKYVTFSFDEFISRLDSNNSLQ